MAYNVRYIEGKCLNLIENEWKALQIGQEMTLFQTYDWFQMLLEHYIPEDTNVFESVYAVVESEGHPCMIAPLWIIRKSFRIINKQGVYLLGRDSFSDYLNFIYKQFDGCAFNYLLYNLSQKYGVKYFTFENIRESTSIFRYIQDNYTIIKDSENPCVGLRLPSSIEEYQKTLSKNCRQNLRTSNNRLKKDGINLVFNFDNQKVNRKRCLEIRETKLQVKYAEVPLILKYKYRIMNRIRFHFPRFTPITSYTGSKVMTVCDDEGNLRAFFNYGYDPNGTFIRVMAAGTDLDFARYSPGMLLMYNFILKAIDEGKIKEIDFTRGDEMYKLALGGKIRHNHTIKFQI